MRWTAETEAKYDRWLDRAQAILAGRANGMGLPVIQALALRGHARAMADLANRMLDPDNTEYDPARGLALEHRLFRMYGDGWDGQNLSTRYRRLGNMVLYRYWLRRTERGDPDVADERRGFHIRFWDSRIKRFGRYRPPSKRLDGVWPSKRLDGV